MGKPVHSLLGAAYRDRVPVYASTLCVFHAWKSGFLVAATLQMAATVPDLPFVEYTVSESPLRRELVRSSVELRYGVASIPQAPGLGVELDEEILERYRTDR